MKKQPSARNPEDYVSYDILAANKQVKQTINKPKNQPVTARGNAPHYFDPHNKDPSLVQSMHKKSVSS